MGLQPSGGNQAKPRAASTFSGRFTHVCALFFCLYGPHAAAQTTLSFDRADEAEAAFFLLEQHLDPEATIEQMRGWYAERVRYYGRGVQDKAVVLTDKQYYVDRWPVRVVDPDLSTLRITAEPGGGYAVVIEVDFTVSNDRTTIGGRTRVELTIEKLDGGLVITRESGRILSRDAE